MNVKTLKWMMSEKQTTSSSLENSQGWNWKNKQLINSYLSEQHHGIKWTNLCESEISLCKNRCSPKEYKQKLKTWMEN